MKKRKVIKSFRWKTEAKSRLLRVQNLNIALQFIADEGIRLVACGSEGTETTNLKLKIDIEN